MTDPSRNTHKSSGSKAHVNTILKQTTSPCTQKRLIQIESDPGFVSTSFLLCCIIYGERITDLVEQAELNSIHVLGGRKKKKSEALILNSSLYTKGKVVCVCWFARLISGTNY